MYFIGFIIIPLIVACVVKFVLRKTVNWVEMGAIIVIPAVIGIGTMAAGRYNDTVDYEVWNGQVENKEAVRYSCNTSWSSFPDPDCTEYRTRQVKTGRTCFTDSKGKKSCHDVYSTEYKSIYSWEKSYFVYTDLGDYRIRREDSQGAVTPKRWASVQAGDPVSKTNRYTNWVKGSSHSLFNESVQLAEQYADEIPAYPIEIYDYYRVNRVLDTTGTVDNLNDLNERLSKALRVLGPEKQANAVLVITDISNPKFANAVWSKWNGAKKNDIVVIVGKNGKNIDWAWANSWSKADIVNVKLRDDIVALKTFDAEKIIDVMESDIMQYFERRPMAEFEYLKDEIEPPVWVVVLAYLLTIVLCIVTVFVAHRNDF